ncbi:MAG: type II secretion system F family protein [Eubacteriales bacterium]|nr:type II secretion system F family protein [Eubacteriales bacterium]
MALYKYEVMDKQGKIINDEIDAADYDTALTRVKDMGYVVLDMSEKSKSGASSFFTLSASPKKVTLADLSIFSRQLSAMLSAGIPVTKAIDTLSRQTPNKTLTGALTEMTADVEEGSTLTDAFAKHPKIFNDLYISMIQAGETGGMLEVTLMRLSQQLHKDKKLRDDVKASTAYPKMVGIFAVCVFIGMLVFLVPVFEGFMPNPDAIPAVSAFIFAFSRSIRQYFYIYIAVILIVVLAVLAFLRSRTGHDLWERYKLRLPLFGKIMLKVVTARFSRTLATLVDGGIPIIKALQTAGPTSGSDMVASAVDTAVVKIEEGAGIAAPLEESQMFPPMVTHMIAIGEESGTLPAMLDKIAEFYEEEVETATKQLSGILEPLILVLVAVLVGAMLIALYLPIFTAVVQSGG